MAKRAFPALGAAVGIVLALCSACAVDPIRPEPVPIDRGYPTARLTATVSGDGPWTVHLDASGSSDPQGALARVEWDIDNDGVFDTPPAGPQPGGDLPLTWDLPVTEPFAGTSRIEVTDSDGHLASAKVEWTAGTFGQWHTARIDTGSHSGPIGLTLIDGRPALYCSSGPILYAHSSSATGAAATDWRAVWLRPGNPQLWQGAFVQGLADCNGAPAIITSDNDVYAAWAPRGEDRVASAWQSVKLDLEGQPRSAALCSIHGVPMAVAAGARLQLAQATAGLGTAWTTTELRDRDAANPYSDASLAEVAGRPALACVLNVGHDYPRRRKVFYGRSRTASGADRADWDFTQLDELDPAGHPIATLEVSPLKLLDGRPSLLLGTGLGAYTSDHRHWTADSVRSISLLQAGDADGGHQWSTTLINAEPESLYGLDLAQAEGRLTAANDNSVYRQTALPWQKEPVWRELALDSSPGDVKSVTLLSVAGHLAIAYYKYTGTPEILDLDYAIYLP